MTATATTFQISVVICAHNPRPDYLKRVIESLRAQTLPMATWELLLVDNASKEALAQVWDLSWHGHARHILENRLGLANARARAIQESKGTLLVFVDDDNVLDRDYLEQAWRIHETMPLMGAWGGQLRPEYEVSPLLPETFYRNYLAIREFEHDRWSNIREDFSTSPIGAGLCIRRQIAESYLRLLAAAPERLQLGRTGDLLLSGEDIDLVDHACTLGFGKGLFRDLRLLHLIPAQRMTADFLIRQTVGRAISSVLRAHINQQPLPRYPKGIRSWMGLWFRAVRMHPIERRIRFAELKGINQGLANVTRLRGAYRNS